MSTNNKVENFPTSATISNIEEQIDDGRDPLYPYPHIESILHFENPVTAWHFADILDNYLPAEALKGTSHHGDLGTYHYSREGTFHNLMNYLTDDIARGVDVTSVAQFQKNRMFTLLQEYGLTISDLLDPRKSTGMNVVEIINANPRIKRFDPTMRITLANMLLAERTRRLIIDPLSASDADPESAEPQLPHETLKNTDRMVMYPYTELTELFFEPGVLPNTRLHFGGLMQRYALHMPLKITSRRKPLPVVGVVHELGKKIAQGLEAGEDMLVESARSAQLVEEFLSKEPVFRAAFPKMALIYSNRVQLGIAETMQYSLLNYLFSQFLIKNAFTHPSEEIAKDGQPIQGILPLGYRPVIPAIPVESFWDDN